MDYADIGKTRRKLIDSLKANQGDYDRMHGGFPDIDSTVVPAGVYPQVVEATAKLTGTQARFLPDAYVVGRRTMADEMIRMTERHQPVQPNTSCFGLEREIYEPVLTAGASARSMRVSLEKDEHLDEMIADSRGQAEVYNYQQQLGKIHAAFALAGRLGLADKGTYRGLGSQIKFGEFGRWLNSVGVLSPEDKERISRAGVDPEKLELYRLGKRDAAIKLRDMVGRETDCVTGWGFNALAPRNDCWGDVFPENLARSMEVLIADGELLEGYLPQPYRMGANHAVDEVYRLSGVDNKRQHVAQRDLYGMLVEMLTSF
jgi:hypothetical protein